MSEPAFKGQKLRWEKGDGVLVRDVKELDELLSRLHAGPAKGTRIIAVVDGPGDESVYYGIGGTRSFVSSQKEPYLTTVGDKGARGSIDYYFQGHHSPIERHHLIPRSVARAVIREFFLTGKLSEKVPWEPV